MQSIVLITWTRFCILSLCCSYVSVENKMSKELLTETSKTDRTKTIHLSQNEVEETY